LKTSIILPGTGGPNGIYNKRFASFLMFGMLSVINIKTEEKNEAKT